MKVPVTLFCDVRIQRVEAVITLPDGKTVGSIGLRFARQIANPTLPALSVAELGRQLEQVGLRRQALELALGDLTDDTEGDIDALAARIRGRFEGAEHRLAFIAMSGYERNALVAELL